MKQLSITQWLLVGFVVGILSGLLGVGGGVVMVPILTALGMNQHKAHATSLTVVVPIAIVSSFVYGYHGQVDWVIAGCLCAGSVLGARVGALWMHKIPALQLKMLFSCVLILAGARMVLA